MNLLKNRSNTSDRHALILIVLSIVLVVSVTAVVPVCFFPEGGFLVAQDQSPGPA